MPGDKRIRSGFRHDSDVIIFVSMKSMLQDGVRIWRSANDIVLTSGEYGRIHPRHITQITALGADGFVGKTWQNPLYFDKRLESLSTRTATLKATPRSPTTSRTGLPQGLRSVSCQQSHLPLRGPRCGETRSHQRFRRRGSRSGSVSANATTGTSPPVHRLHDERTASRCPYGRCGVTCERRIFRELVASGASPPITCRHLSAQRRPAATGRGSVVCEYWPSQ